MVQGNVEYLTVTALTKYLKRKFELDPYLERVYLTGEISNYRFRPNGHQYFSLKDEHAKISTIMFRQDFQKLKFQPKEGMKVLVIGRISLYEASGSYQIYIEHMEPDGVGALYQALAEMKEKLTAEGLFDEVHRKKIPHFPKRIAVITSPSGAVIRDIITTVNRRYPLVELVIFPTLVQGGKAANDIVRNIKRVENSANFDTMIIARGGGSIEDLWPFNEEIVARAIYEAQTPIISSVGHETDTTIADLVADVRAATPTAAAELAVPVLSEEIFKLQEKENALIKNFNFILRKHSQHFDNLQQSYIFRQPNRLYQGFILKLDLLEERFLKASQSLVVDKKESFTSIFHRLSINNPSTKIIQTQQTVNYYSNRLIEGMERLSHQKQRNMTNLIEQLDLLSPLKTMARGYTYVTKEETVLKSVEELHSQEEVMIHFHNGQAKAVIQQVERKETGGGRR